LLTALKPAPVVAYPPQLLPSPADAGELRRRLDRIQLPVLPQQPGGHRGLGGCRWCCVRAYGLAGSTSRQDGADAGHPRHVDDPGIAILVPLYNLSVQTGLYNTLTG
jgi:hypothetical protein